MSFLTCLCWHKQRMLPEHIHMRIAESILFAGKAIRVLRNPSPSKFRQSIIHQKIHKTSSGFQGILGNFIFPKEACLQTSTFELFPQSESEKIEGMLQELKVLKHVLN